MPIASPEMMSELRAAYGERLSVNQPLARLTSARVGGSADALLEAHTCDELADMARFAWERAIPFFVLGGGSNILVSDRGWHGLVILNHARAIRFDDNGEFPTVWVESGANFGSLARQACLRGLGGLEWAIGIPGTVGGAIYGNAGAHGADMTGNLILAEILHCIPSSKPMTMKETWPVESFEYAYRTSKLKHTRGEAVILVGLLKLQFSTPEIAQAKADAFTAQRRRTQPPGATMGSMFKNPPGDYAGRLIEAAGLKGYQVGDAEISPQHANFFINRGNARAIDIYQLIRIAQEEVENRFGVTLELEVELVGEWQ
jgi:UDP-N-acetylmuramate dehydrogenase